MANCALVRIQPLAPFNGEAMIWLQFFDAIEDEDKLVQMAQITHMMDRYGKLHMVTTGGQEHVVMSSVRAVLEAVARVPIPAPAIIIIGL